MTHSKKFT